MARVDVVVVCWNDKDKIATALDSVFALTERGAAVLAHQLLALVLADRLFERTQRQRRAPRMSAPRRSIVYA